MAQLNARVEVPRVRRWGAAIAGLTFIVLAFVVIRIATDWPHIIRGTTPEDDFAERYVAHPWLTYGHIVPGVIYLLGVPLQLSAGFRTRHYNVHRRLGRALLGCALLSGTLALVVGVAFAWGGVVESLASVVFGLWFLLSLSLAFVAIRAGRVSDHRRWMIRAFAVGIGIATIRIWVGLFTGVQLAFLDTDTFPNRSTFGLAFWLGLGMHVLIGEWWLRSRASALGGTTPLLPARMRDSPSRSEQAQG